MFKAVFAAIGLLLLSGQGVVWAAEADLGYKPRLVVFDLELQDASHEGEISGKREDQTARLILVSRELRKLLSESGKYDIVDIEPARAEIARKGPLIYCNGCDGDIAAGLGGELALTGFIYKVSNLILEIHLYIRDTKSGNLMAKMTSSIRGNNDKSWLHGIRWMFRNRLMQLNFDKEN